MSSPTCLPCSSASLAQPYSPVHSACQHSPVRLAWPQSHACQTCSDCFDDHASPLTSSGHNLFLLSGISQFSSCCRFVTYTLSFKYPHKNKSKGLSYSEQGGYSTKPLLPNPPVRQDLVKVGLYITMVMWWCSIVLEKKFLIFKHISNAWHDRLLHHVQVNETSHCSIKKQWSK